MTDNPDKPAVLIVDDDKLFCDVLADALTNRGYETHTANTINTGLALAEKYNPEYALIDLRIGQESGLTLAESLHALDENTRIVMLTGYASITTAVEAIKLGAIHYLTKPAEIDDILAALHKDEGNSNVPVASNPLSVKRLEWEHLQRVLADCNGNISAAARQLKMHRRSLQRKLAKKPVRE